MSKSKLRLAPLIGASSWPLYNLNKIIPGDIVYKGGQLTIKQFINRMSAGYTGVLPQYGGEFYPENIVRCYGPIVVGMLMSQIMSKLGVNSKLPINL